MDYIAIILASLTWICSNSHFDCVDKDFSSLPAVQIVEYNTLYKTTFGQDPDPSQEKHLIAHYNNVENAIYVYREFKEIEPSLTIEEIIVHEMVHYLQDRIGPWRECGPEAEYEALQIQLKWQEEFNRPTWFRDTLWYKTIKLDMYEYCGEN